MQNISKLGKKYNLKTERLHHIPKKNYKLPMLPTSVDLRNKFGPVYDQGTLSSCTANALMGVFHYDDPDSHFYGSRLFLYYNERKADGDLSDDAGSTISQGVNVLHKYGVCSEISWPYDVKKFNSLPPSLTYKEALLHKAIIYEHIEQNTPSIKGCLASGFPIALGIQLYESFESTNVAKNGIVPIPLPSERCLGGHAVVCCGYDDTKKWWIMRNSWGSSWGDRGYFYLPYTYLTDDNLCSDLWKITKVTSQKEEPVKNEEKNKINKDEKKNKDDKKTKKSN